MSLFNWFAKKEPQKEVISKKYMFSDEDREASSELRNKKKELEMLKLERESELHKLKIEKQRLELQQEIDELKGTYDDVEEASENGSDMDIIKALIPFFLKMQNNNTPVSVPVLHPTQNIDSNSPPEQKQHILDEDLKNIWNNTPQIAKDYSKNMNDEQIILFLKKQMPNADDNSLKRALNIIRTS